MVTNAVSSISASQIMSNTLTDAQFARLVYIFFNSPVHPDVSCFKGGEYAGFRDSFSTGPSPVAITLDELGAMLKEIHESRKKKNTVLPEDLSLEYLDLPNSMYLDLKNLSIRNIGDLIQYAFRASKLLKKIKEFMDHD